MPTFIEPCSAIQSLIATGMLEPIRAIDGNGCEVRVYVPTELAPAWFGERPRQPVKPSKLELVR